MRRRNGQLVNIKRLHRPCRIHGLVLRRRKRLGIGSSIRDRGDIAQVSGSIMIMPVVAQPAAIDPISKLFTVSQGSAPTLNFACLDATIAAVDLSAKIVTFIAATAGVTISGAGHNAVAVALSTTNTATAREGLQFWLWNITDNLLLSKGELQIPAANQA